MSQVADAAGSRAGSAAGTRREAGRGIDEQARASVHTTAFTHRSALVGAAASVFCEVRP